VHFDVPHERCLRRLERRTGHPTIRDFTTAQRVISGLGSTFTNPCLCEGLDLIFNIPYEASDEEDLPNTSASSPFSPEDIQAMLVNFAQAARAPYRPKRPSLPPNPRLSTPASGQSYSAVRSGGESWRRDNGARPASDNARSSNRQRPGPSAEGSRSGWR